MIEVRVFGILAAIIMMYLAYLGYKRSQYSKTSYYFWLSIWFGAIILIIFPQSIYGIMNMLKVERTADFFVIVGFMLFNVITFHLYVTIKQMQRQMDILEVVKKNDDN